MEVDDTTKAMEVVVDEGIEIAQRELSGLGVQEDGENTRSEIAQRELSDLGVQEDGENTYDKTIVWDKDVEEEIKVYLLSGKYPDRWKSKEEKRSFRRRAQQFVVNDGQLFYKRKTDGRGSLSITLATKEEQKRAFQVCTYNAYWCKHISIFIKSNGYET